MSSGFFEGASDRVVLTVGARYCILRSQGVPLGGMDYLNGVFTKVEA